MLSDQEFQAAQRALQAKGQLALTKEERKQRQRALDEIGVPSFIQKVSFLFFSLFIRPKRLQYF
mgnify:FL=1